MQESLLGAGVLVEEPHHLPEAHLIGGPGLSTTSMGTTASGTVLLMRVVSWNLNRAWPSRGGAFSSHDEHGRAAWTELAALNADVALLQEANPPPTDLTAGPSATLPDRTSPEAWRSKPGPARRWCSAIATWGPPLRPISEDGRAEPLYVSQPGAYAVGVLAGEPRPVVLASVYALWDYGWLPVGAKPKYAHTSLHRAISDLTPVLDTVNNGLSVVLAGDFNTSSQFASPHREAFHTVHARLADLGLHNVSLRPHGEELGCPCADKPCRHVQTIEGPTPYQDDYIYVSGDLLPSVRFATPVRSPEAQAVSDHYPVSIEVDFYPNQS